MSFPPEDVRSAFEHAVYELEFTDGPREFAVGRSGAIAPPFVILTAWNPLAAVLCVDENVARNSALRALIEASHWHWLPAENHAPDGTHLEPGFAIFDVPAAEVAGLAALFGQSAIFIWDGREGRIDWLQRDPALSARTDRDDNHAG